MPVSSIIKLLSILTIGAQILLLCGFFYFFLFPRRQESALAGFLSRNGIKLGFLVALAATSGSLFFSEGAGFEPCRLCWFQRVFMYPQVVLLGLAWLKKDSKIVDYSLALAIIGALISLYHNYVYYTTQVAGFCGLGASGISCATRYFSEFGYITIPMMALTGFLSLIFLLSVRKALGNKE
jgi:disulfide bond formation protein DsbB